MYILYNSIQFIYPDQQFFFDKPQFISTRIKENINFYNYIYAIKFNEIYGEKNKKIPISIIIISKKYDIEQFKYFLFFIYTKIINSKIEFKNNLEINTRENIKTFKNIELLNILFYSFTNLIKPPPHSTIKLSYYNDNINFYFNSNCELPNNNNDIELSYLFQTLNYDIIIKVIFLLLTNKSVELISSNPLNLLYLIPAFLKLIYPIKLDYLIIPIVPINNESYNKYKQKHFFGLLNVNNLLNEKISEKKGCTIIDCDNNIMYKYNNFVPYCPIPTSELSKPKNLNLTIYKNKLMKYNIEKGTYENIKFLDSGKVYIDTDDENNLVNEHNDSYLSKEEYNFLRREVNKIKVKFLNKNNKCDIEKRNFDYQINILFCQKIYSKLMNDMDSLSMDMRIQNNFNKIKQDFKFDNISPKNIMNNLNLFNIDLNYFNSYFIEYKIIDFPFEESNEYLNKIENFNSICNIYKTFKENLNNGNLEIKTSKNNDYQSNFYGNNGFINFFNQIKELIKEKENEFYINCYNKRIYDEINDLMKNYLTNDLTINNEKLKINKNNYSIDLLNFKELNYSNFYLYLSFILENIKKSKIYYFDNNKFNNQILQFYNKSYKLNFPNFTFYNFYKFIENLSIEELNNIQNQNQFSKIEKTLYEIIKEIKKSQTISKF